MVLSKFKIIKENTINQLDCDLILLHNLNDFINFFKEYNHNFCDKINNTLDYEINDIGLLLGFETEEFIKRNIINRQKNLKEEYGLIFITNIYNKDKSFNFFSSFISYDINVNFNSIVEEILNLSILELQEEGYKLELCSK